MKRVLILIAVVAVVSAACASDSGDASEELPVNDQPSSETEPIPSEPDEGTGGGEGEGLPVVSEALTAEVEAAVADLTERLASDSLIQIVAAHELTWPDGSLGCPDPDTAYTQALVDGYRIELELDGDIYAYHGATGELPFLCENELEAADAFSKDDDEVTGKTITPVPPTVSSGEAPADAIALATQDLAARLGVSSEAITVFESTTVLWPNGALGCPQPGRSYTQAIVEGYRIVLEADGGQYRFHGSLDSVPFLCPAPIRGG